MKQLTLWRMRRETREQRRRHNATPASKAARKRYEKTKGGLAARKRGFERVRTTKKYKEFRSRMNKLPSSKAAKDKHRKAGLERQQLDKRLYGFVPGERESMERAQNNLCAICGNPPKTKRLAVDHCHKCDHVDRRASVRGLLCSRCNRAIFNENPALLRIAAAYFEAHQCTLATPRAKKVLLKLLPRPERVI